MTLGDLLTDDEEKALHALSTTLLIVGTMFQHEEGTPEALRMALASIRSGADTLEAAADRWERELRHEAGG